MTEWTKCEIHSIDLVRYGVRKKKYCPKCSQDRVAEQRRKNKIRLVQYFGGKCIKCDYDKCITALTFHHRDPNGKEFSVSHKNIKSFSRLLEEAKKCDLLCHNCHSEEHSRPEDFNYKGVEVQIRRVGSKISKCAECGNDNKDYRNTCCSIECAKILKDKRLGRTVA